MKIEEQNSNEPQNPQLNIGAVISRFNSTVEKQQSFYSELKALLIKYDAELSIEDFGRNWQTDEKIVVDFKYDESFFEKENTGIIPQLVISRLQSLTKYEASIGGGCECCGSWVEHEADKYGDWIKVEDIEALVKELQANGL